MSLSKDLVFLILQFCNEESLNKTAHMLEQETGYFFDLKYFEELLEDGNWEEADKYLSSFTLVQDNKYSTKIYFEIRKQKFLEALDKYEHAVALDILLKDLKVFAQLNKELYKEMTQLLALDDFREHCSLASYGDTLSARKKMINELRPIIEANPLLQGKTKFPQINKSRLRRLVNQSLNWQHIHCAHPHPQPHIDTLFTDHKCPGPDNMLDQFDNELSLPSPSASPSALPLTDDSVSNLSSVSVNRRKLSTQDTKVGDDNNRHDATMINQIKPLDEVASPTDFSPCCQDSSNDLPNEFPSTVERILNMGSSLTSMDFHPIHETLLLVGIGAGDIELWDVASAKKLFWREFKEDMDNISRISVNRVLWSPDGSVFGVAYSKIIIQLHSYHRNGNYFEKKLEIDAHVSGVNDIAFSKPHDKLFIISCGDDKLIQVWDAVSGAKQYTFEGHGAPVYSLCPHVKENIHFLFSISTSGEIKTWLFDNKGSRVTYNAPGFSCMRMAYSADGKRLFSCGTNKMGESYIVEWNESEGFIVRNYNGLSKSSSAMVQFDTSMNRFLAAGDEYLIKIWDMDNSDTLDVIDAQGCLPVSPYICFNKKGCLLAVSADDNQIKILANDLGRDLLQISAVVSGDPSEEAKDASENIKKNAEYTKMEMPNISKIVEVSRCQSVLLSSEVKTNMIRRLVYTHAGNGILALTGDGIHLLWKWLKGGGPGGILLSSEATTKYPPQLWQPRSGLLMINDVPGNSLDVITPCFSLSKNDSYIISASGKMISLYNMLIFKKIRSVMAPPPAATCIVFYPPDNNIIAIGMDDSSILIYNIRVDEVISKLEGHSKRISGLTFSTTLNVLVSCGVDTQIVLWDSITWEKKKSTVLQISVGWLASDSSETNIQLDKDQKHFLAVHETQLAIYETTTLRRVKQWTIAHFCTKISHATYSCDSQLVYAAMRDGILIILDASDLRPRFEIDPSAYLPPRLSCYVDPIVVAAHPHKPDQFALGLSNGEVVVIEPIESQGKWTILPRPH